MVLNRNILRSALILSYIILIVLITFGVSALYSYLNTGADRSKMLHLELKKVDQYLPKINWEPLTNEGREMDEQTLNKLENDYLDAWYVKNVAYNSNKTQGIDDYYTENARKNILDFINLNTQQNINIETTTLEHHPNLEFFSEDGQLAVLTDNNVKEFKRIYQNNVIILETTEISNYKAVFLLEDGFWRIRHLVKDKVSVFENTNSHIDVSNLNIKGINYYPQASAWDMYGSSFSTDTLSKDFKIIKGIGLNTIRVFVPYEDFGKAKVDKEKLEKLKKTLDTAETNNLKVVVTLFDFYGDYSVLDWSLNERHAETIVSALKKHNALLAWDIKNEPNLDFESRGKDRVLAWLKNMINLVRTTDNNHPITIGWSNTDSAAILTDKLDFICFHYYEDLNTLEEKYKQLKIDITNKPIVLGEYGLSSYSGFWKPFGSSNQKQADYHKKAQDIFTKNNIQFMSWTLYDFTKIPKEVVGRLPWRKNAQKHFGFIDKNGAKKEAFKYISKP